MFRIAVFVALVLLVTGCGDSNRDAGPGYDRYPVVTDPPPEYSEPVTEATGAVVSRPVKPTEHEMEPSPSCQRQPYKSASGGTPLPSPR